MFVCARARVCFMYVRMYICTYACVLVFVNVCRRVRVGVCIYVFVCVCACCSSLVCVYLK